MFTGVLQCRTTRWCKSLVGDVGMDVSTSILHVSKSLEKKLLLAAWSFKMVDNFQDRNGGSSDRNLSVCSTGLHDTVARRVDE